MATMDVKDASGSTVSIERPLPPGRAGAVASRPIVLSDEDKVTLDAIAAALSDVATDTAVGVVVSALASILAKLSDDPPTQTTLAAVLAKLPTNPAPMQETGGTIQLAAGSSVIGKIGIDQTTPGTSNKVVADHSSTGGGDGRKTVVVAGTAETLVGATTPAKWIDVQALPGNTGKVAVGFTSAVLAAGNYRGKILNAGESVVYPIDDLHDLYVNAAVSGEGVTFTYGT